MAGRTGRPASVRRADQNARVKGFQQHVQPSCTRRLKGWQSVDGGLLTVNPDVFGVPDTADFPDQAPTKKLKLNRRHALAVFGASAVALGVPAALGAEPARQVL